MVLRRKAIGHFGDLPRTMSPPRAVDMVLTSRMVPSWSRTALAIFVDSHLLSRFMYVAVPL
jgi:hypothetical protein